MSANRRVNVAKRRVERWLSAYTRGLPVDIASARIDEVRSDLHEQTVAQLQSADGLSREGVVARSIEGRTIRGIVADLGWRDTQMRQFRSLRATTMTAYERRSTRQLSWLLYAAAVLVSMTGLTASARAVVNLSIYAQPGAAIPMFVSSILAILSLGLILRTATRAGGVLLLTLVSWVMNWSLLEGSSNLSARFGALLGRASEIASIPVVLVTLFVPSVVLSVALVMILSRLHRIEQHPTTA